MLSRSLGVVLGLLLCGLVLAPVFAQEGQPKIQRDFPSRADTVYPQQKTLTPVPTPAPAEPQVRILTLRDADAAEIAKVLQDLFPSGQAARLRIALHRSTNSLIVMASSNTDLELIESIVQRLDVLSAEMKKNLPEPKGKDRLPEPRPEPKQPEGSPKPERRDR
jgi:hypothetical protein